MARAPSKNTTWKKLETLKAQGKISNSIAWGVNKKAWRTTKDFNTDHILRIFFHSWTCF